jgi:hypothetical protein
MKSRLPVVPNRLRASRPRPVRRPGSLCLRSHPRNEGHRYAQTSVSEAAPALAVWQSLVARLTGSRRAGADAFAVLVGAEPRRATTGPFAEGSTLPGFAVAAAEPGRRLRLTGRHRFSKYALVLNLDESPDGTVLSARTYAEFPGLRGKAYRQLVIGSGAHHVVVTRLLRDIGRRAERGAR